MPAYLDCNATTPVEAEVAEAIIRFTRDEYGNAGSRTHEFGTFAKQAVQKARDQIRSVVNAEREEVIFTSGATESDNLAILLIFRNLMTSFRSPSANSLLVCWLDVWQSINVHVR